MSVRLTFVSRPLDAVRFDRLDRSQRLIVIDLAAVDEDDERLANRWMRRRATIVAVGYGALRGFRLSAGLWSDVFFLSHESTLHFREGEASQFASVAGAVRRAGRQVLSLLLDEDEGIGPDRALATGLVDALCPDAGDLLGWARQWIGRRSVPALIAGASLLRYRGRDVTERWEFARLFATGEPQRGLGRFLDKHPVDFSGEVTVEYD